MADNVVDGVMRVGLDMSGVEKATPKAIQAFKALEREALKSTGAIAARGKQNLDQLGAAATAMQAKMAAVGTVRAAPGLSNRVAGFSNQLVSQAGAPGAVNTSLSSQIAGLRNNYLVTSGQMAPVQGPKPFSSLSTREKEGIQSKAAYEEQQQRWAVARAKKEEEKETRRNIREDNRAAARLKAEQDKASKEKRQAEAKLAKETRDLADARRKMANDERRDQQKLFAIQQRLLSAPEGVQSQINALLGGSGAATARLGMRGAGASMNQSYFNQMTAGGVAPGMARYLVGGGGGRPPGWGGGAAGGGGVGGFINRNLGRFASGIASGIGIGVGGLGGYAAVQGTRAVVESTQAATAYNRQMIAAKELAGSQGELNDLLAAYEEASGGAINKTTELNNVTRLLATGFAKSAEDVERYVRATRGAAIALGKPEDYIIQETQLAISNTSQKRLDQIGLGIKEVVDRVEELREKNKAWSRESAFQEAVLSLMEEKYAHLTTTLEGQATGLEKLRKAWADLYLAMGQGAKSPVDAIANNLGDSLNEVMNGLAQFLENADNLRKGVGNLTKAAAKDDDKTYTLADAKIFADPIGDWADRMDAKIAEFLANFAGQLTNSQQAWVSSAGARQAQRRGRPSTIVDEGWNEEQQDVINKNYESSLQIEKNYNKARLDEIRSYEEQRANTVRDFGRQMAREEEDFFRQRARSQRDYERSIVDLMRDAQERDAEMREDLEDKIADAREDSGKKIAEIEKEFNESREEAAKEHLDNLMKAAGQLDAIAVLEERKRWRRDQEQANKQHEKALKNEKDNLEEKIAEAREAYEEQLEDARKADAKRLEDMRVNRERQLADEDEDRAIRLARAQEDHDLQLEEMDRQHSLRMTQIAEQAEEERAALEEAFGFALNEVGIYVAGFQKKMEERDALIEAWFGRVVDRLERQVRAEQGTDYYYDPKTGPKIPTNYTTPLASSSSVTVSGGKSVVVQPGAIVINAHPAMDEERVADYALSKMADFLEEYNR